MKNDKDEHVSYQKSFFEQHVDFFKQEIPAEIEERSAQIVKAILRDPSSERLLDVGTGTGAFIKHYLQQGLSPDNIIGCDLCENMLSEARARYPMIQFWLGDVLHFPSQFGKFDLVVFNACFGNIFDPLSVLRKTVQLLRPSGRIVISHPCNTCMPQLLEMDPKLVLRLLPEREQLVEWCDELEMQLINYRNEKDLYLAILELPQPAQRK